MTCMQWITVIVSLNYVLAGEAPLTASDFRSQMEVIKTELDLLKKVMNSVLTKTQQSTGESIVARPSNDIQLLQLRMSLEAKTRNLEKEIENAKSRQQRYGSGLASLSYRLHMVESQQNMITKQALLEARLNLMMTQSRDQASELNDLKKQVAVQEKVLSKCETALTSLTRQVDTVQQLAEQKDFSWNQTSEQDVFKITQADLRDKQNLVMKTMAHQTRLIKACDMKVEEYKDDCMGNINNRTSVMEQRINTFSRKQQNQSLQIKQQETFLNWLTEQRAAQDNKTSAQLKHFSDVYKQLNTDLNTLDVAHNRLEQDFANHTQQAKETDDFLKSQQKGLQMQQAILTSELIDLESHLNLTYAMLNETKKETTLNDKCKDLRGFKKGQVLSQRGSTQGTFGRDQLSQTGAFYSMDGYDNARTLKLYHSEADFINNNNVKSYSLPIGCDGAQAQMIGGKLFCAKTNAPMVLVYDLTNLSRPYKLINLSNFGTRVAIRNTCHYEWGGYSDIDIEVDETGIYILWASVYSNCNFVLGRVDPQTFTIGKIWQIPITKTAKGNAFMVCGKLYVTASYNDKSTTISHVFDTRDNNIVTNPGISYSNEYGYGAHAHYDYRDKALYVWDNRHQLRVEIEWKSA